VATSEVSREEAPSQSPSSTSLPHRPTFHSLLLFLSFLSSLFLPHNMSDGKNPMAELTKQFLQFYYANIDGDRSKLQNLYKDGSTLIFSGGKQSKTMKGRQAILTYLVKDCPIKKMKHRIVKYEVVPSGAPRALLVSVIGDVKLDNEQNAIKFSQTFHIIVNEKNQVSIGQDIFFLNYG
jgi:hypothetical protein